MNSPLRIFVAAICCWTACAVGAAHADLVIRNEAGVAGGNINFGTTVRLDPILLDLQIENTGSEAVAGVSLKIEGAQATDFRVAGMSSTTIPAGSSITVRLAFKPGNNGSRVATMTAAASSAPSLQAVAALSGTGTNRFTMTVTGPGTFTASGYGAGSYILAVENGEITATHSSSTLSPLPSVPEDRIITGLFGSSLHRFLVTADTTPPPFRIPVIVQTGSAPVDHAFLPEGPEGIAALLQADGKLIVTSRAGALRLNADGSRDLSFSVTLDNMATSGFVQPDGKIVLSGHFDHVNGRRRESIVRLHPDGAIDETFVGPPPAHSFERVIGLPDGKMMVIGGFGGGDLGGHMGVMRLHADGTIDESFSPAIEELALFPIYAGAVQPDGKVLVGSAVKVAGVTYPIARFNADGSIDASFMAPSVTTSSVTSIAVQPDGKILIGGHFSTVNGAPRSRLARLNVDGTLDYGFSAANAADEAVSCIALQADGKILIGGVFKNIGGLARRLSMARLHPDGEVDGSFAPEGYSERLTSIALGRKGEVYATGPLGFSPARIAVKVENPGGVSLFESGADYLSWTRSGPVPEVGDVVFESSADSGTTWTKIGDGVRDLTGWRLDGVSVPSGVFLRARGHGVIFARGFSLCAETMLVGRAPTTLEGWRLEKFGSPLNESTGRDNADADADGVPNLVEYAFSQDPLDETSRSIPSWTFADGAYQIQFPAPASGTGVSCGAEWSGSLSPDDWHPAEPTGDAVLSGFRVPAAGKAKVFVRLKVSSPLGEGR